MTTINLIRHGQTDWNAQHRIQGLTDIELNDVGRRQAVQTAASMIDDGWQLVVSSPLKRAYETATIIAGELGLGEVVTHPLLVERSFGEVEGMTDLERVSTYPVGTVVPGAETREHVLERALTALNELADDNPGRRVVVVSHGGLIGQVLRYATDQRLPGPLDMIQNGAPNILERDDDGSWTLTKHSVLVGARDHAPIL